LGFVADVDDSAHAATAEIYYHTYRFGQVIRSGQGIFDLRQGLADVDQDQVRTLLGQPHGMTAPHTASRAGDQNAFTRNASRG
jgi:hypothetical protein